MSPSSSTRERIGAEQLVVGLAVRDAGDPPAHEPLEPARVGQADRAARRPTARPGAAAALRRWWVRTARSGEPVVQAFVGSVR